MTPPGARRLTSGDPVTLAAVAIVAAGFCASLLANYPGHFPPDAVWQLAQGRSGVFDDWHPPAMAWLLGLADRLQPGAWPFVLVDAALFYGGLLALVALRPRPRIVCLPLLVLWMISPVVLVSQGVVVKDVLFANSVLAGFAALAWAGRAWNDAFGRGLTLAAAFVCLGLAALTRQNGFLALVCGAAVLVGLHLFAPGAARPARRRWLSALASGIVAFALTAGACEIAKRNLAARGDHRPQTSAHVAVLQVYDLSGALRRDPALPLQALDRSRPDAARFLRLEAAPIWRAAAVDNIVALPGAEIVTTPDGPDLARDWWDLIRHRPELYIRERIDVWTTTLATPLDQRCPMIITGVDSPSPELLRLAGLGPRETDQDDWDFDYAALFLRTPLYSHLFYGTVLLAALLVGISRWRAGDRSPGLLASFGLGATAVLVTASYAVISIACDYRFLYFLDVAGMGVSAYVAASRPLRRAAQR